MASEMMATIQVLALLLYGLIIFLSGTHRCRKTNPSSTEYIPVCKRDGLLPVRFRTLNIIAILIPCSLVATS
jgi:hypothetical protein